MERFNHRAPPLCALTPNLPHGLPIEQDSPLHYRNSHYESEDYGTIQPSTPDLNSWSHDLNLYDTSHLHRRWMPTPTIPLPKRPEPYLRHSAQDTRLDRTPGTFLDHEDHPHFHPHEHRSRLPTALPSLSNRVESEADDPSYSPSSGQESPPSRPSKRLRSSPRRTRCLSTSERSHKSAKRTSKNHLSKIQGRHLAAAWRELYHERRKFEGEKAAFRGSQRDVNKWRRQRIHDLSPENSSCSASNAESETMEIVKIETDEEA